MDTRSKIVERDRAPAFVSSLRTHGLAVVGVSGYFDVLTEAHLRRLQALRGPDCALVIAVHDPADSVMSARARAEVAAALDLSDCVVPAGTLEAEVVAAELGVEEWCDDRSFHHAIWADLIEHVQRRQDGE